MVIEILKKAGALLAEANIEHSYPHCWRCHHPTIFRATEQWFIGMDRNNLRERALDAIKTVKWTPAWGEERISNMIADAARTGAFRASAVGRADHRVLLRRLPGAADGSQDSGSRGRPVSSYVPTPGIRDRRRNYRARCQVREMRRHVVSQRDDILDVWFDSGVSHLAVLTPKNSLPWPADMYLEGGDQYRGWFHSSLLVGVALKGAAPYRATATNGWTLDGEGHAISKSRGV